MPRKAVGWGAALVALVIAFGVFAPRARTEARQAAAQASGGPRYTVVDTEGTNLMVVDNGTNTLYFYTVESGKEVGDDLHLRGSLDLSEVGRPVLKPKKAAR
jgi:hypothetical protein